MEIKIRTACRAILLTPEREIFLIKIANPAGDWVGWITPGGGLDPGESEKDGLRRELFEELGVEFNSDPIKVWERLFLYPWNGRNYQQHDTFFLFHTQKFERTALASLTENEKKEVKEMRWWSLEDIKKSSEIFVPRKIGLLVEQLADGNIPSQPIQTGE